MSDSTLASAFRPATRFYRSTDLERDFRDSTALDGYCLTEFTRSCLARISRGLISDSSARAWRLTGDYGSGKSSFALLLAASLSAAPTLPNRLKAEIDEIDPKIRRAKLVPVLVVGSREPMSRAILRSLSATHTEFFGGGEKDALDAKLRKLGAGAESVPENVLIEVIDALTDKIVKRNAGSGLLLVLDEVGKFLEHAALHPDQQDVYLLQRLGERASRSGKHPFLFVCLLHQGFNAYADNLATPAKREWEKIAGRLEEILFQHPLDQVVSLLGAALNGDTRRFDVQQLTGLAKSMETAIKLGWYGAAAGHGALRENSSRLYPIDPMLVPVMVRLFQRYGQNERSVFNFLFSFEPLGLQAFAAQRLSAVTPYRLHHFYDYVRTNLGHRLAVASYRTHWSVIESVIDTFPARDALDVQVMKTVGLLNLLNSDDTLPSEEAIAWAVAGSAPGGREEVKVVLRRLRTSKHLYFRGAGRGYCLWPHSSVDVEARYEDARREIPQIADWSGTISRLLDTRPLVARRHYIVTGNLRYLKVVYCGVNDLAKVGGESTDADGRIIVPLCENETEYRAALRAAVPASMTGPREGIRLVAVPRPLDRLSGVALDAMRWDWVLKNTPELNHDRYAREEVARFNSDAANRLDRAVQDLVGLNRTSGTMQLRWFDRGEGVVIDTGKELISYISDLCDNVFQRAPRIHNELVNRHQLSSAAAAARMRLIESMFAAAEREDLDLPEGKHPPERSMYLSVLKHTGLHHAREGGGWALGDPAGPDRCHVKPALHEIRRFLEKHADQRIPVSELMSHLRRPPFGMRDGLIPIFLAVVAIAEHRDVAVYENGTFLRDIGKDAFLRLSKNPERFDIQYCRIDAARAELFQQLTSLITKERAEAKNPELLDLVRDLCGLVSALPEFTRNTHQLSKRAIAVRAAILDAQEPIKLIFHQLPVACGFGSFGPTSNVTPREAKSLVQMLKESIEEIRSAYARLEDRILRELARQLDDDPQDPERLRKRLSQRAEALLPVVTDMKLKALCLRMEDSFLTLNQWVESVGSVLGLRPPSKWRDDDEAVFRSELAALAGQFLRVEAVNFARKGGKSHGQAIRIALTQAGGAERQQVLFVTDEQAEELAQLKTELKQVLGKNRQLGLAAASQLLWEQLKGNS